MTSDYQALAVSRISIRDFSGRDFLIFLIPGFYWNLSGFFGIFIFALFACQIGSFSSIFIITVGIIITTTIVIHHHHSLRSLLATNVLKMLLSWMWRSMCSLKNHAFTTPITILLKSPAWIHISCIPLCVFKCVLTVIIFWPPRAVAVTDHKSLYTL